MAYRNGTYVAFHANGTNVPIDSDIKYYNLIKAWESRTDDNFTFTNSHDKTSAVRDTSKRETLSRSLRERLLNSKNMLLILGPTTKHDDDWVPYEITYAVDICKIPIIVCYKDFEAAIRNPRALESLWPEALKNRINNQSAHCIHIPFKKIVIHEAINQFSHNNFPNNYGLGFYNDTAYNSWGIK